MSRKELQLLAEPQLEFAYDQCEEHPKDGLYLYGPPDSPSAKSVLRYAVIGTSGGIKLFDAWQRQIRGYIPPYKPDVAHHAAFPGFQAAFGMAWPDQPVATVALDGSKLDAVIRIGNRHEAIKKCVDLYADAIQTYLGEEGDVTPDLWFVIVPDDIYRWGRTKSAPPKSERIAGDSKLSAKKAKALLKAPTLFGEENEEAELQLYDLNFHNQIKARLLGKAVVQIIRERTLTEAIAEPGSLKKRTTQDPATVAWNLCTTIYYKSAGPPWRLRDIRPGVCYVGIVFKQDSSDPDEQNACCGAQLFLRSGEGLVFRGAVGHWYSKRLRQFHLTYEKAAMLMKMAIDGYRKLHGQPPTELFVHGRSRFDEAEWNGFLSVCPPETALVGIRIKESDGMKLYRLGRQPVVRGTFYQTSPRGAFLWTKGYVPRLNTYPGFEVPNPLSVNIDWGTADLPTILSDILSLTKVNFNSCTFADGLPVTLKFADAIGEILTAAPHLEQAPQPFKYYI